MSSNFHLAHFSLRGFRTSCPWSLHAAAAARFGPAIHRLRHLILPLTRSHGGLVDQCLPEDSACQIQALL